MMPRPEPPTADAFPRASHDHADCAKATLDRAQRLFEAKGLKLTDMRVRVLQEIAASHEAVGAYDILARLQQPDRRIAPISVYRAIDALLEIGVIHRLESRNAYFACHTQHGDASTGDTLVLVCETCGRVAEVDSAPLFDAIAGAVRQAQFLPRRTVAEVSGTCRDCRAG